MNYLSQMIGVPVVDATGETIGTVNDVGIATGEVFPRITSLAFQGPSKTPFMISWRKYVESISDENVTLNVASPDIRFSYLQPSELLLNRDLMDKQIVDTQGLKVVRVNDLKISLSGKNQLRLLGAEVGIRGLMRGISPKLETLVVKFVGLFGKKIPERLIAWNYMDLLERDLSQVKLSVTHKRLGELHPADVADIIEQIDPRLRASVFAQLDTEHAADAMAEMEDEYQADVIDDLPDHTASDMIASMDPDDAADLLNELSYDKAERLLKLMGIEEQEAISKLLGYKDNTAGGIMTSEFVALEETKTVSDVKAVLRQLDEDHETIYNIYTLDAKGVLTGVLSLRDIALAEPHEMLQEIAFTDLITVDPSVDQEEVANLIAKYDLVAMPVVDEKHTLLGIVTVDDALDVMKEEHQEDLQLVGSTRDLRGEAGEVGHDLRWLMRRELWFLLWIGLMTIMGLLNLPHALIISAALPVILLVADDTTSFAIKHLIEEDENEPSMNLLSRTLKGIALGLIIAALVGLVAMGALGLTGNPLGEDSMHVINTIIIAGALTVAITIALSTPLYRLLAARERADATPSTTIVSVSMMIGASALFVALSMAALTFAGLI